MFRDAPDPAGCLQASIFAEYTSGDIPNPTGEQLIDLAKKRGVGYEIGELIETGDGKCKLGVYGSATFRSQEFPWFQIWYLSNGYDFVLATYICEIRPASVELKEVQDIVTQIDLEANPNATA